MKKVRQFIDTSGKLSQEGFLKKLGIPKTFLTFHNLGSYTSEFVEIGMPYMIIYEATDRKHGELNSLEFTESNKNYFFSSVSRLDLEGKRSLHSHDFYGNCPVIVHNKGSISHTIFSFNLHSRIYLLYQIIYYLLPYTVFDW